MSPAEIEGAQARCFEEDFRRLGPSIYRSLETWFFGYLKLKDSPSPYLRLKAERFAKEIRKAYRESGNEYKSKAEFLRDHGVPRGYGISYEAGKTVLNGVDPEKTGK